MTTRQATLPPQVDAPSDKARLALTEAVLFRGDSAAAARTVLRWLKSEAGVKASLCMSRDVSHMRFVVLAAEGLSGAESFDIDLAHVNDPLVLLLESHRPVHVKAGTRQPHPRTPFGDADFHAIPLVSSDPGAPTIGLLLLRVEGELPDVASWAADLLATRLAATAWGQAFKSRAHIEGDIDLLQTVIDAVSDPILVTDAEGRLVIGNRQARFLLQADDEASEGRRRAVSLNNMLFSAAAFTTTDDAQRRREVLLVDPALGEDLLFELLRTTVADAYKGELTVSVLRNVNDLRRATQEIEDNYRRLRLAEADVRAERDQLDLILNTVVDPILVTDPSGAVMRVNAPAARLFLERHDDGAAERRVQTNHAMLSSFVSNLYTGQAPHWRAQLSIVDPDSGENLPFEAVAGQVFSRHGQVSSIITHLRDQREAIEKARLFDQVKRHSEELKGRVEEATAELLQRNEQLQHQAFELEQASSAKSQFLANMSHELRTPLTAIIGYTSLLVRGTSGELAPKPRHKLERIDANARHLLALINDLLDISRIEAGKMPLKPEAFSFDELAKELLGDIAPLAKPEIELRVDLAKPLPELFTDRQKLKQILLNLLSNALKFTQRGSVRLSAVPRGERIAISVIDTGIGIAPSDQQRIFEDFRQADNSYARQYGGSGLGLSISKRIAEMLGGYIELASESGKGSTFTVNLPQRLESHEREASRLN